MLEFEETGGKSSRMVHPGTTGRFAVLLAVFLFFLSACDAPLTSYEPDSAEKQSVKQVLLDFERGVNERSADKVAALLHPDARIMIGNERTVVSRDDYLRILPQRLLESPAVGLGTPKIALNGNRADVRIYMTRGDAKLLMVFHLLSDAGRWQIESWEY